MGTVALDMRNAKESKLRWRKFEYSKGSEHEAWQAKGIRRGVRVIFGVEFDKEDNGYIIYWDGDGDFTQYWPQAFPDANLAKEFADSLND